MKIHVLQNPPKTLLRVEVWPTHGGWHLNIQYKSFGRFEAYDGYTFKSDSSAKRYYSTAFQSIKSGALKPIWKTETITIN